MLVELGDLSVILITLAILPELSAGSWAILEQPVRSIIIYIIFISLSLHNSIKDQCWIHVWLLLL